MTTNKSQTVNLLGVAGLIHKHLTSGLCRRVHHSVRNRERQRQWTLHYLSQFWVAVILRAPNSLRQALTSAGKGQDGHYPKVRSSAEAFFEKCRDLNWNFFLELYRGFTASILAEAPEVYARALGGIWERFPNIFLVDGSKCDAIRHRLKLLWNRKEVVLPGCLTVFYDLGRGITRHLIFSPNAAEHELPTAIDVLPQLPKGTLVVGDRLYALPAFFRELSALGLWGLFRLNKRVKIKLLRVLSRKQGGRTFLEDSLVEAGSGQGGHKVVLRWIRYRHNGFRRDLFTQILDPKQLSAEEALDLYPWRWRIERLFFDLKEVLNLHRFYAANPNAIAMQIYAAAMVHTACRVAQARIAMDHGICPEEISPAKLYPRLAVASCLAIQMELYHRELEIIHGKLTQPNLEKFSFATTTLDDIRVEKRKKHRQKKSFHPLRRKWKSLTHIHGFKKLT